MYCEVVETVKSEEYFVGFVDNYGYVKLPDNYLNKDLLVIFTNMESKEEVEACLDGEEFMFKNCNSRIRTCSNKNKKLSVKRDGLTNTYLFICVLEKSDAELYLFSDYTVCRKVNRFNNGECNLILPNEWIRHRIVIVPFGECFVKNGVYSFDTVECFFKEANLVEYRANRIYMNSKYGGVDCMISHV